MNPKNASFLDLDRRFYTYLWPYRLQLGLTLITMAGAALMDIASPWPLKFIVDNVIGKKPYGDLLSRQAAALLHNDPYRLSILFVLMIVLFALLGGAMTFAYGYLQGVIQEKTTFRLRSDVFAHLQSLSLAYHDQSRSGELIARVTRDADNVMDALVHTTGEVALNFLNFAGVAIAMFFINWRFSFMALAYAPLLYLLFRHFRRKIRAAAEAERTEDGQILNVTHETISAIRLVKAYGREAHEQRRFDDHGIARLYAGVRSALWGSSFEPIIDLIKAVSLATVVLYGTYSIFSGNLTVGELLIFVSYMATFYSPLKRFSKLAGMLQVGAVSGQRLTQLLDTQAAVQDHPQALAIGRASGRIEFRRVTFSYANAAGHAIGDFSFVAKPGQRIAIVGATGAGKTTLANLLMRFYDPASGEILLDRVNLRQIQLASLRRQFALVPQEALLFATSVRDNIAYGRPEASFHRIVEASKAARAHEFIMRLPQRYDTILGERGASLSVGQRQRITIARAVLQDAPILILDEPTSALDSITEYETMRALDCLMEGRTTFVIAHRLSTTRNADRILVVGAGRLIESGTHDDLMALGGYYSALVRLQTGDTELPPTPRAGMGSCAGLNWVLADDARRDRYYSTEEIAELVRTTRSQRASD
jgi:ATP-binding cassette, subfamily B, bacterial